MQARAVKDHERALEELTHLLEKGQGVGADDRAVALFLRADSRVELEDFAGAAKDFRLAGEAELLAPLRNVISSLEAQAWLDAGDPDAAAQSLVGLKIGAGVGAELHLLRADVAARSDAPEAAVASYKAYLASGESRRAPEARAKLARVLSSTGDGTAAREAAHLWAKLELEVPLSDYAAEARKGLRAGGDKLLKLSSSDRRARARKLELATLKSRLKRRQYSRVEKEAKKAAAKSGLPESQRCELLYLQGSALFKQRKRPASRPVFEKAAKSCAKAKNTDLEVKTRYQGARGRYAEGQYSTAARAFEALAKDHPTHSYADDALIKAGETWESGGKRSKAAAAYGTALRKHPSGDMAGEARRRSLLLAFFEQDKRAALHEVEAMLATEGVGPDERAKLIYFRARAKDRAGKEPAEVEADLLAALRLRPLSYVGVQAMSRLHELGPESFARGVGILETTSDAPVPELALPGRDVELESRARLWSRMGFGDRAWDSLKQAGIKGWPAARLMAQAGDWPESQRRMADLGSYWRQAAPADATRAHWELAHPRPFAEIIESGEPKHAVPSFLTFAIMQTESRFDPNVVSWAGARGLVQLMPATAKDLADKAGVDASPGKLFDPSLNLGLGMRYLGRLSARWGGGDSGALMAAPSYNAGAGSVDKWVKARGEWPLDLFVEAIPYDETRRYTQSVMGRWFAYRWLYAKGDAAARIPIVSLTVPRKAG